MAFVLFCGWFLPPAVGQFYLHQLRLFIRTEVLTESQLIHHLFHLLSFTSLLSCDTFFLGCGLWFRAVFTNSRNVCRIQHEIVIVVRKRNIVPAGIDSVFAMLLVLLGNSRGLVHVLDDFPPADSGVVRAEGDLTELRRIRNDAHLGSAEVIVE